ncbi:hypothetical protein [Dehalobacter restrictus]|uniref:hypothetical protein n=1 Tax=Dehalobacter restrictus TaxID=55583 RepID=UPI00338F6F4F
MTTAVNESKKEKNSNARPVLPVTWRAIEPGPHKRWWWYVAFIIVMVWLMSFLILLHEWFVLACVVAATVSILVIYGRAPRQMAYRLDSQTLTVNKQTLQLDDYRAFTTQTARVVVDGIKPVIVILLPRRRLGFSSQIALPENVDETTKVLNTFWEVLPFDDAKDYLADLRFLDRFAHWLRLN